jgi:5-methylcytosine-specific restriction enzyme subunit McrC
VKPSATSDVVELREWDERLIPNVLSPDDRLLAEQLAISRRLVVDELTTGLRIRSQCWVGLIQFETFALRVVPKLADGNIRLVQMLALTGGLNAAWQNDTIRTLLAARTPDLLDILSALLIRECERILAGGVLHDYVEREDSLNVLRGRFLADRQWRRRFGQFNLLECRFDEHESDIDENRILAFALRAIGSLLRDQSLRQRVISLHELFASICECDNLDLRNVRTRLIYHRLNSHYAGAHELCWLILDAMGVADLLAKGPLQSNVFLIDMNLVFQRFVRRLVEISVGVSYQVQYQKKRSSILWDLDRNRSYSTVIPDFVLMGPGGNIVVDAKYKPDSRLDIADIYQCFLYAQAFGNPDVLPSAFLVAPSLTETVEYSCLEVRSIHSIQKATLHRIAVPVAATIDEMQTTQPGPIGARLATLLLQAQC